MATTGAELAIALVTSSVDLETLQGIYRDVLDEQDSLQGKFDVLGEAVTTLVGMVQWLSTLSPGAVGQVLREYALQVAARRTE